MTRILGVDPGGTTGIAVIDARGPAEAVVVLTAQVPAEDMPKFFVETLLPMGIDYIALEKFTISPRTLKASRTSDPLDVIGGVKWMAALQDPPIPVKIQMPSDAKTAYPNDRLTDLGLKCPGTHSKDALRHAMLQTHTRKIFQ